MAMTIPHTNIPLPVPTEPTASQIAYWNRGRSTARDMEGMRIMACIRPLLPYVKFLPRDGRGGWDARPGGFKGETIDLGWVYTNALDILDDLVADLTLIQPSMSRCTAIEPSSNIAVAADVARHLPGRWRSGQLLFQYALTIARTATLETVRAYNPAAFPFHPSPPTYASIIIPFTSNVLPAPPPSQSASQIAHWNRGVAEPRQIEALRVMAIIRLLLPYAAFSPRAGRGGWDARPDGFKGPNDLGWGYANTLDILDDLVADLTLLQPSMSQCAAIDPSSDVAVEADVAMHLPNFSRPAQLLLQYALTVARSASVTTVQAYNPAAVPPATTKIIIPHTSRTLPAPPPSQSASQIAYWNRGGSTPNEIEGLRVTVIIRFLLSYVQFTPRDGRGGWDARPAGFKGTNDLGWSYVHTLDTLDELVTDLSVFQPSMSLCAAIDPTSNVLVDADVAQHLPGFSRSAQLFLQYALTIARSANLATVRAYNPLAFPPLRETASIPRPPSPQNVDPNDPMGR